MVLIVALRDGEKLVCHKKFDLRSRLWCEIIFLQSFLEYFPLFSHLMRARARSSVG